MRPRALVAVLVPLLACTLPVSASASEVGRAAAGHLTFVAADGEENVVDVRDDGASEIVVSDKPGNVLATGPGCRRRDGDEEHVAACLKTSLPVMTIELGDLDDEVVQTDLPAIGFVMRGGPGADTLRASTGLGASVTMIGGEGTDVYVAGDARNFEVVSYSDKTEDLEITLDDVANDPDDENVATTLTGAVGGAGDDHLSGSAKGDHLGGGDGTDRVEGLGGADRLYGGPGDDRVSGGPGGDLLIADPGADALRGGDGVDRYEPQVSGGGFYDTTGGPRDVTVTLDDVAGDGQQDEGDDVRSDIEQVRAVTFSSAGRATLTGSAGANTLTGSAGGDRLDGGPGADVLDGAGGDDTIAARDGTVDTVDCGTGADTATVDAGDVVTGCETVLRPEPPPAPPPASPPRRPPPAARRA